MLFWLTTHSLRALPSIPHYDRIGPSSLLATCNPLPRRSFLLASLLILREGAAHRATGMRAQRAIGQR